MTKIYLNGRLVDQVEARIDPLDRGLLLADGLFETLRAYGGRAFRLEAHLARLIGGARLLGIPLPPASELAAAVGATLAANKLERASIRITVTRGTGPRGLLPPPDPKPTLMVVAHPLPAARPASMTARVADILRNEHSPLSRIKSLGYLENILALREAAAEGADEAVMLNTVGRIACGSRSNLFLVLGGITTTPPLSEGALPGVTRAAVLELAAAHGIPAREALIEVADIADAEEAFLTNSLLEVVPLTRIGEKALPAGPVAAEIARLYRALAERARSA